jgi:hypothetical protein
MLCPRCYGKHVVLLNGSRIPCPECAGVGELHCCDGLREQEECPLFPSRPTRPALVEYPAREAARTAS